MKMVKGLLLGSAAGIVAMTGAQAADLPVKAKAVEYVKVCSIYGEGFYYIPGTDTCLKVGGYVRLDVGINAGGSHGAYMSSAVQGRNNREDTPYYEMRTRGIVSWDARSQTEYGTLRAYVRAGWEQNSGDANYRGISYFDRAFIQFAGFTFGKTQSFFGFYANALNYTTLQGGGQSDAGLNLVAYTAQFAGGFSASIAIEDAGHHRNAMLDANTAAMVGGAGPGLTFASTGAILPGSAASNYGNYAAPRYPDIVANLRVDQPWGSAQISGAVHDVSGSFYGPDMRNQAGTPSLDATGWAVQAGVKFNLPWAQGDEFWVQGTWTRGATTYLGYSTFVQTSGMLTMYGGNPTAGCGAAGAAATSCGNLAAAWIHDAVFNSVNGISLTEGWSVIAAVQHYWTPALRTSVFGHYTSVDYDARATNTFCTAPAGAAPGASTATLTVCNPDFRTMQIGTRTIWSPVRNMDIGVEVLYSKLDQSHTGNWTQVGTNGARAAGLYEARDRDTWSGTFRFQRNFWP